MRECEDLRDPERFDKAPVMGFWRHVPSALTPLPDSVGEVLCRCDCFASSVSSCLEVKGFGVDCSLSFWASTGEPGGESSRAGSSPRSGRLEIDGDRRACDDRRRRLSMSSSTMAINKSIRSWSFARLMVKERSFSANRSQPQSDGSLRQ